MELELYRRRILIRVARRLSIDKPKKNTIQKLRQIDPIELHFVLSAVLAEKEARRKKFIPALEDLAMEFIEFGKAAIRTINIFS